jgi:hypothetical protein
MEFYVPYRWKTETVCGMSENTRKKTVFKDTDMILQICKEKITEIKLRSFMPLFYKKM